VSLRLGLLADLHCSLDPAEAGGWHNPYDFAGVWERIDAALAWFGEQQVELVALAGDLTHRGDPAALLTLLERCLRGCEQRLVVVGGNHDVGGSSSFARELERLDPRRLTVATPRGEERGGIRLAGLQVASAERWFRARLAEGPDLAAWGDQPALLLSHFPLLPQATVLAERGLPHPGDVLRRAATVAPLIDREAPVVVLSGHVHVRDAQRRGPVLQLTQGALIEPPYDAAIVELGVRDGRPAVTRTTRRTAAATAPWEPVLVPGDGSWSYDGDRWQEQTQAPVAVA
jgi:predicted phosphodiesterase